MNTQQILAILIAGKSTFFVMLALCVNEIFCWNCPLSRYLPPRGCRDPNVNGGNVNLVPESMTALVAFNRKEEGVLPGGEARAQLISGPSIHFYLQNFLLVNFFSIQKK